MVRNGAFVIDSFVLVTERRDLGEGAPYTCWVMCGCVAVDRIRPCSVTELPCVDQCTTQHRLRDLALSRRIILDNGQTLLAQRCEVMFDSLDSSCRDGEKAEVHSRRNLRGEVSDSWKVLTWSSFSVAQRDGILLFPTRQCGQEREVHWECLPNDDNSANAVKLR